MKQQSWSALLSGENGIRSLTFTGGVMLHAVTVYIVITILPSLINDIGGEQYYSWVATVFITASLIGTSLATNTLGKIGPRNSYAVAILIFAIGTFMCSIAPNMPLFLMGRFIQGFGSGSLLSLSYSIIRIVFSPHLWSRALGIISGMWGISTLLGPAIGGISVQYSTWRASFWIVGFLAIIFLLIALKVLPKNNKTIVPNPPLPLSQLFILNLLIFIISTGSAMDATAVKVCGLVLGISLLFVLAKIESSTPYPMLPRKTFSISSELFSLYSLIIIMSTGAYAIEFYFPLFLQELYNKDPIVAGYMAALISIGWTCSSLSSAGISTKKIRSIIVYSPVFSLLSVGILLWLLPTEVSTDDDTFIICLALFAIGMSSGITWPHFLTRILQCARDEDALRASESLTSVQLFSMAFITALAGIVTNLAGLSNPGGITGMISAVKALLIATIGILFCLGIPFSLRVSRAILKNPTGQSKSAKDNS
ncbi:MFS transporter [Bartonella sp. A05]|uniref:MFS transporter n=1 Tax=Bartonella sp. A05 TaxID=2967261 RepID=UPI0022A9F5EE|nr:MFS transporter [Bartonella sp. A05]MCZ2204368.1 MFS transporter [Bartonella sp. A05]